MPTYRDVIVGTLFHTSFCDILLFSYSIAQLTFHFILEIVVEIIKYSLFRDILKVENFPPVG